MDRIAVCCNVTPPISQHPNSYSIILLALVCEIERGTWQIKRKISITAMITKYMSASMTKKLLLGQSDLYVPSYLSWDGAKRCCSLFWQSSVHNNPRPRQRAVYPVYFNFGSFPVLPLAHFDHLTLSRLNYPELAEWTHLPCFTECPAFETDCLNEDWCSRWRENLNDSWALSWHSLLNGRVEPSVWSRWLAGSDPLPSSNKITSGNMSAGLKNLWPRYGVNT